jgi:NAD(P)-dependent dehydrogenase (short-subunit alcohol dehydrogenase family)
MSEREFAGRVVIVTGASKGIGFAVAAMLARRGADLVIVGRDAAALDVAWARLAEHGGRVVCVAGDVAHASTANRAATAAVDQLGRLDVLANIAGAFPTALLEATTDEAFAETIAANLTGTFAMCRAVLPVMRERGGGAIVNMSSTAARLATPGLSAYGAAKAGIEAFTRAIALEGAPSVRVNAVSAGPTITDTVRALVASDTTGAVETVTKALPLGRMAEPDEIAEAILFLASDRAAVITGQVLHANSGGVMA